MFLKDRSKEKTSINIQNINSLKGVEIRESLEGDLAIIFCNVVTTSLRPSDGDVLRINLKLCYLGTDGNFSKIRKTVSFFQDPERKLSDDEARFLDFSLEEKKGSKINWDLVGDLFSKADLVIAHSASFVKPWITKHIGIKETLWGCSIENVNWSDLGFPSRNLEALSVFSGFFYDFDKSAVAIDSLIFCLDINRVISSLIEKIKTTDLQIFAANAPIELKDLLKERRYRWNPDVKCWWLPLTDQTHGKEESAWLLENVPGTEPQIFEIDPKFRFGG